MKLFGNYLGNILGSFGDDLGMIWGLFENYLGNIIKHIWKLFGTYLGIIWELCNRVFRGSSSSPISTNGWKYFDIELKLSQC